MVTYMQKYLQLLITTINKDGEKVKETQWYPIVFWGKKAEIAEKYILKRKRYLLKAL